MNKKGKNKRFPVLRRISSFESACVFPFVCRLNLLCQWVCSPTVCSCTQWAGLCWASSWSFTRLLYKQCSRQKLSLTWTSSSSSFSVPQSWSWMKLENWYRDLWLAPDIPIPIPPRLYDTHLQAIGTSFNTES